jgi:hypothetical protein
VAEKAEVSLLVEVAHVTSAVPALLIQNLNCLFGALIVPLHKHTAAIAISSA